MPNNLIFLALHFTISKRALLSECLIPPFANQAFPHVPSIRQFRTCYVSTLSFSCACPVILLEATLTPNSLNARRSLRKRTQFSTDFQPSLPVISLEPDPILETERYPLHHPNDEPTPTASQFDLNVKYTDDVKPRSQRHRSRHFPRPLSDPGHVKLDVKLKIPEVSRLPFHLCFVFNA